jgi:hypothetical protein
VKNVSPADALNCAETLLEFLEQKSYSYFAGILTLRKLRTSIKLKIINWPFSGRLRLSVIFDYPANGNRSLARIIEVLLYLIRRTKGGELGGHGNLEIKRTSTIF